MSRALLAKLTPPDGVTLHRIRYGKYAGQVVARATAKGINLSAALLAAGLARPYDGGTRPPRSSEQRHAADSE